MGKQLNTQNYFFEECRIADYTYQQKTREDINQLNESLRGNVEVEIQYNYKKYSKICSEIMQDSSLLKGEIEDPGFRCRNKTKASQEAFYASRDRSLKKILVVTGSASKVLDTRKFAAELDKNTKDRNLLELNDKELRAKKAFDKKAQADAAKAHSILQDIYNYLRSLCEFNPTAFVKWVGTLNLYRLSWTFSRISWKTMWLYLQQLGILSSDSKLHGVPINITVMDVPNAVFNFLSVYIFFAKLAVNISLPIKHALAPTYVAEEAFTASERFWMEIKREWVNFFNDGWWIVFNAITNFPKTFGIAIPVAGWILTGALFFDVGLLLFVSRYEEAKIAAKIKWLDERIADHEKPLSDKEIQEKAQKFFRTKLQNRTDTDTDTDTDTEIAFLDKELQNITDTELRIKLKLLEYFNATTESDIKKIRDKITDVEKQLSLYHADLETHVHVFEAMKDQAKIQRSGFRALIGLLVFATVLFIASLALTLSLASPIVAPIGFFVCIVAVALILSREEFSAIAEIRSARNVKKEQDEKLSVHDQKYVSAQRNKMEHEAWVKFGKTFAEHVFVPMLIIGLFTINWPLAVVFTVTYVIYKCLEASKDSREQANDPGTNITGAPNHMVSIEPSIGVM